MLLEPVADVRELDAVAERVRAAAVPHYVYSEPYRNWGMTSLIALARTEEQRSLFKRHKKWNLDFSFAEGAGAPAHHLGVGLRTNPPLAQSQSVWTLNLEDRGATPRGRAKVPCE